jgi:hypothetical protein
MASMADATLPVLPLRVVVPAVCYFSYQFPLEGAAHRESIITHNHAAPPFGPESVATEFYYLSVVQDYLAVGNTYLRKHISINFVAYFSLDIYFV